MQPQLMSSKTDEHGTPDKILESVYAVLGVVDLDPCSNSRDAPNVKAEKYYTREDDGLNNEWHGKVFMNPPYGKQNGTSVVDDWVSHFICEYDAGRLTEGIILVAARTETLWFKQFKGQVWCAVKGRLKFKNPDNKHCATFPSAVVYYGPNVEKFIEHFKEHGTIWKAVPVSEQSEPVAVKARKKKPSAIPSIPADPAVSQLWEVIVKPSKNACHIYPACGDIVATGIYVERPNWIERMAGVTYEKKIQNAIREVGLDVEELNFFELDGIAEAKALNTPCSPLL